MLACFPPWGQEGSWRCRRCCPPRKSICLVPAETRAQSPALRLHQSWASLHHLLPQTSNSMSFMQIWYLYSVNPMKASRDNCVSKKSATTKSILQCLISFFFSGIFPRHLQLNSLSVRKQGDLANQQCLESFPSSHQHRFFAVFVRVVERLPPRSETWLPVLWRRGREPAR